MARDAVGAVTLKAACPEPWYKRPELVTQAVVPLERDGMVLAAAGLTRRVTITRRGRLMPPRRAAACVRCPVGGRPHAR